MTRRDALVAVAGVLGVVYAPRTPGRVNTDLRLVLDNNESIEVVYRGQVARITPAEIMAALTRKG